MIVNKFFERQTLRLYYAFMKKQHICIAYIYKVVEPPKKILAMTVLIAGFHLYLSVVTLS